MNSRILVPILWSAAALAACAGSEPVSTEAAEQETGRATKGVSRFTTCDERAIHNPVVDGTDIVTERYDFAQLTRELAEDLDLAEAVGLDAVTSCEEARRVAEVREAIAPAPRFELPEDAAQYPIEDLTDTTKRGLWVGDPIGDQRWLHIRIPTSLGESGDAALGAPSSGCTAIPISSSHILTAAHCIPSGAEGWWRVRVMDATPSGSNIGLPGTIGNYRVFIYQHEGWSGESDTGDDIAILSMHRQCVTSDERDAIDLCTGNYWDRGSNNSRVWLGNLSIGIAMDLYGYGSTSRYSQTSPRLHEPPNGARISVDWTGPRHFLTDDETTAIVCKGDSGGPAVLPLDSHDYVAGVLSNGDIWPGQFCARDTGSEANRKQRWHRLSGTFADWIEPKLGGNAAFTCPSTGATCCNRYNSTNAYTGLANHSYARCW